MGALRSGAFAFVPKSFRPEELISTVEQALTKVRLAREREELERRYRALVELTDVLVVGLDASGRVALFNRKAALFAGVEPSAALGWQFVAALDARGGPGSHGRGHRLGAHGTDAGDRDGLRRRRVRSRGPALVSSRELRDVATRRRVRWHLSMARGGGDERARLRLRHRRDRASGAREARRRRRGALGDGHARAQPGSRSAQPAQRRGPPAPPARPAGRQARHRRGRARRPAAQGADRRRRDRATQPPAHGVPRARAPARRLCASSCTSGSWSTTSSTSSRGRLPPGAWRSCATSRATASSSATPRSSSRSS